MHRFLLALTLLLILPPGSQAEELSLRLDRTSLFASMAGKPEQVISSSVSENSDYAGASFEDGSALIVFRGHATNQVRDIQISRYDNGRWSPPSTLSEDGWRTTVPTTEGPSLSISGGRAAVAWFTGADNDPRVLLSTSPDAGGRFTMPVRISEKPALGRVSAIMLRDSSMIVTWIDAASGALLVRHVGLNLRLDPVIMFMQLVNDKIISVPRLLLIKGDDLASDRLSFTFYSAANSQPQIHTVRLSIFTKPAGLKPCVPCDEEDAKAVRGFAVHARIVKLSADRQTLTIQHDGIPGVMRAQALECKVDPATLQPETNVNREVLARIERRGRQWWIFDLHELKETSSR